MPPPSTRQALAAWIACFRILADPGDAGAVAALGEAHPSPARPGRAGPRAGAGGVAGGRAAAAATGA